MIGRLRGRLYRVGCVMRTEFGLAIYSLETPSRQRERGVIMPIVATFLLGLGVAMMVYSFQKVRERRDSARLQGNVDKICLDVSSLYPTMLQRQAADGFRTRINALVKRYESYQDGRLKVTDAKLVIPTTDGSPAGGLYDFSSLTGDGCNLPGDKDCMFVGEPDLNPATRAEFPANVFSTKNIALARGNIVGCSITYEGTTAWGTSYSARVSSIERLPIRRGAATTVPPGEMMLSIAIAPQMTTDWTRPRFQFLYADPIARRSGSDPYLSARDPLPFSDRNAALVGYRPFSTASAAVDLGGGRSIPNVSVDSLVPALVPPPVPPAAVNSETERKNLAVACMNPAILVRNLFVQTLLELAARDGELQSDPTDVARSVEVLAVNPQNEGTGAGIINKPVTMFHRGETLRTDKIVQQPMVFYHTDIPGGNQPLNPLPLPLPLPTPTDLEIIRATQLRMCHHMYGGFDPAVPTAGLLDVPMVRDVPMVPGLGDNANFESPDFSSPSFYRTSFRDYAGPGPGLDELGQRYIWPGGGGLTDEGLLATEAVATLGSVQRCPYVGAGDCGAGKPDPDALVPTELSADIVGLLDYYIGTSQAFTRPGFFDLAPGWAATLQFPFGDPTLSMSDCPSVSSPVTATDLYGRSCTNKAAVGNHIVLVLHQAPRTDPEVTLIQDRVQTLVNPGGPNKLISVIYIPVGAGGAGDDAITRLFTAFRGAGPDDQPSAAFGPYPPMIFVMMPLSYLKAGEPGFEFGRDPPLDKLVPDVAFSNYWHYLLDFKNNPRDNVVIQAQRFFLIRLMGRQSYG